MRLHVFTESLVKVPGCLSHISSRATCTRYLVHNTGHLTLGMQSFGLTSMFLIVMFGLKETFMPSGVRIRTSHSFQDTSNVRDCHNWSSMGVSGVALDHIIRIAIGDLAHCIL